MLSSQSIPIHAWEHVVSGVCRSRRLKTQVVQSVAQIDKLGWYMSLELMRLGMKSISLHVNACGQHGHVCVLHFRAHGRSGLGHKRSLAEARTRALTQNTEHCSSYRPA